VSLHLDTPYQITKALGEFYCNYFNDRVSTVRCRFFKLLRPRRGARGVPKRDPQLHLEGPLRRALGDHGHRRGDRDFIYVDDLVDGLMLSATVPGAHGEA